MVILDTSTGNELSFPVESRDDTWRLYSEN
jgi:hypothetical protein